MLPMEKTRVKNEVKIVTISVHIEGSRDGEFWVICEFFKKNFKIN